MDNLTEHFLNSNFSPSGEPYLLVRGGSTINGLQTCTSDLDLFAICPESDYEWISRIYRNWSRVDLELRTCEWLRVTCDQLDRYTPPIVPVPPELSFWDLRFMTRCALGERLFGDHQLYTAMIDRKPSLQLALLVHASTDFVNIYEDLFGLYREERYDEILLRAGELLQAASRLALLNVSLVDPALKWAVPQTLSSRIEPLMAAATRGITLLRRTNVSESIWTEDLLRISNEIVALGWLHGNEGEPSLCCHSERLETYWCFPGLPNGFTVLDIRDRSVQIINRLFIEILAASSLERV